MRDRRKNSNNDYSGRVSEEYLTVMEALTKIPGVSQPTGAKRKGFGSSGLYAKGKIFALLSSKGEFVVKLPRERVDELVARGSAEHFDPRRNGRVMKEWAVVKSSTGDWVMLAREAMEFVGGKPPAGRR